MPELNDTIKAKIDDLREMSEQWGQPLEIFELVKIDWISGAVYYAATEVGELNPDLPVSPVEARLIADSYPDLFLNVETSSAMGDEEVDLKFWDGDGIISDLAYESGEGVRVEIFYYFPAVDLLLSHWHGHLRTAENADSEFWTGKAANGFRSPNLPMPKRAHYKECQAIFGAHLDTLEEIAHNDCPYNAHLPGGTVGNGLFTTCDRKSPESCTARGVHPLYHLSHQSAVVTVFNGQTSGPQLLSVARGNETNLKDPFRVVMGRRRVRDMQVLAFRRDYNNNNPDKGFFDALYEACEGPIRSFQSVVVSGQPASALHYAYRLGTRGQISWGALSAHGYSGTAWIRYNYGWVNPGAVSPQNMRADAIVEGLDDIRVYSDENTFTRTYTNNRAWQLARMLTDRRWGFGLDYVRLGIASFVEAAAWANAYVRFTTPEGINYDHVRSVSDVELTSRSTQQQVEDFCLAGRFSRPFLFEGKMRVEPLRALTEDELADCPVFTDFGETRNIIVDGNGKSSLTRSQTSDLDLPNRVEATYHDQNQDWTEQTAPVAEDIEQQLRAGRVQGDHTRRQVTKKYSFLGVTQEAAAVKLEYGILWFGEFDEGGLKNNLRIKFKAWFMDVLKLHENKIIKVVSKQIERYGFEYFRIIKRSRAGNLHYDIEAQAYNHEAMTEFETVIDNNPGGGGSGGGTGGGGTGGGNIPTNPPCPLEFGEITLVGKNLRIPVLPC
jgi:hypothetical protein